MSAQEPPRRGPEIVTIGVYGFEEEAFFAALQEAGVDIFCDVRQRRGVRGAAYAFANSQRLQARLSNLGIRYIHRLDLAPTTALRERQYAADARSGTPKRQRAALAEVFVNAYQEEILSSFDAQAFLADFGPDARVVALFCVERAPAACHRSLIAERLEQELGLAVRHLLPRAAGDTAHKIEGVTR